MNRSKHVLISILGEGRIRKYAVEIKHPPVDFESRNFLEPEINGRGDSASAIGRPRADHRSLGH